MDKKDIATYGIVEYLRDFNKFEYNPIFGFANDSASKRLNWWNAKMGSFKQVHMNIITFKNKTITAAEIQRSYWRGGNKNEFILCIGINDSNKIMWSKVISWTDKELLKLQVERTVAQMNFDLPSIVDTMAIHVQRDFKRKEFKDFKYINVEPTPLATFISFIVTLILTIGLAIFSVKNDIDMDGNANFKKNMYRRY